MSRFRCLFLNNLCSVEAGCEVFRQSKTGERIDIQKMEIEVPDNMLFHSIVVCPVSKEATCAMNPPMMLKCGHVVSKMALHAMASLNSRRPG